MLVFASKNSLVGSFLCLVATKCRDDGMEPSQGLFATEDTERIVQSWTKWCEADAEADETEKDSWFLSALFEKLIKLVLKHLGRPFVKIGELIGGEFENIAKFLFGKLLESFISREHIHVDVWVFKEVGCHDAKVRKCFEAIVDNTEDFILLFLGDLGGDFWPEVFSAGK